MWTLWDHGYSSRHSHNYIHMCIYNYIYKYMYQVHLHSTKWFLFMACQLLEGDLSESNTHSVAKDAYKCISCAVCPTCVRSCTGYRQIGYSRLVLLIQQLNLAGGTHCMSSNVPNTGIHYKWMQSMNMYVWQPSRMFSIYVLSQNICKQLDR